jgi:hypothetical protein
MNICITFILISQTLNSQTLTLKKEYIFVKTKVEQKKVYPKDLKMNE